MLLFPLKALLMVLLLLAALLAFSLRPTVVLGTDGGSLARSLNGGGSRGGEPVGACKKPGPASNSWRCTYWPPGSSTNTETYRLTVDWQGCWSARPMRTKAAKAPRELSGCVSALDHLTGV